MTDEEYLKIRKEYEKEITKRNEAQSIKSELSYLEEKYEVRRYLELLSKWNTLNSRSVYFQDWDLLHNALSRVEITPEEEVYVYVGTYKYTNECDIIHDSSDIKVKRNDENADYVLYYNLEEIHNPGVYIPYKKYKEFERSHNVIIPKNCVSNRVFFNNLQKEYFETIFFETKALAKDKIRKLIKK